MPKIYIASDHGGFELKGKLINWLQNQGHGVADLGPFELDPEDDFPMYAFPLAERVSKEISEGEDVLGILICRSGTGMAIAANKVRGARAAVCFSPEHAIKAVEHDHANILVLDADYLSEEEHNSIVKSFLDTRPNMDEKYQRRVSQITTYEQRR